MGVFLEQRLHQVNQYMQIRYMPECLHGRSILQCFLKWFQYKIFLESKYAAPIHFVFSSPYVGTGRAIAVTTVSAVSALLKMLKFLVKVFKSLYHLNLWMDLVDTLPDVRYWSEVLCCTITTHIGDLEVKATDFEILSYLVKVFGSLYLLKL